MEKNASEKKHMSRQVEYVTLCAHSPMHAVYLKPTATQHVGQSPLQTHQTATQRAPMIMGGLRHHQLVVGRDSGPLERLAGCI